MSRSTAALTIGAVLAATATGLIWWSRGNAQEVRPHSPLPEHQTSSTPGPTQAPIAPASGNVASGDRAATSNKPEINPELPISATLELPDGTRVPSLNGAVNASPLADAWPKNVPWSPIVGIERSDLGVDWFVHEDGSRSTTEMKWRSDLGREDAVTRLARPAPDVPNVQTAK